MSTGFDALHPSVQHHIVNSLGWRSLRPLQEEAIAPILAGEHVVATAPTAGPGALDQAVVVKMMRIAMLAPLVAGVALARRQRSARIEHVPSKRPPLVPLFVLGFLAMIGLRSTGIVPAQVVGGSQDAANLLMAAGLFALGTGVDVPRLARTGGRALALGLTSWLLIGTAAYLGVRLTS